MNSGIDLEMSFTQGVQNLGLSHELAHLLWIPLPMLLVLVSAVIGVLVTVWLERKISAAAQQRIGPEYAGALGILQPMAVSRFLMDLGLIKLDNGSVSTPYTTADGESKEFYENYVKIINRMADLEKDD